MRENRILITGAGGSLGQTVIELLNRKDDYYIPLVKNNKKNIKNSIQCDIRNYDSINKIISEVKPTHIIHLAGITGNIECEKNPDDAFQTNVYGTFNVLKSCLKIKPKIIFSSSREVYGDSKIKFNEKSLLNPININGITKMMGENLILNYNQLHKIPYSIIRFTNFYGENNEKNIRDAHSPAACGMYQPDHARHRRSGTGNRTGRRLGADRRDHHPHTTGPGYRAGRPFPCVRRIFAR